MKIADTHLGLICPDFGPTCHNLRKILNRKFQQKPTYDILRVFGVIYL